ncbi:MAG: T9SS type A sorting domain-containing protein [Chloroherpetonaceae bacterium]|nr:T9SS type A sorting domain-containing protein [Chloroherpetonaceae bacterium]
MYKKILTLLVALMVAAPTIFAQQDTVRFTANMRRLLQAGTVATTDTVYALIFSGASGLGNPVAANRLGGIRSTSPNDSLYGPTATALGAVNIKTITYKFVWVRGTTINYEDGNDRTVNFAENAADTTVANTISVTRYWNDDPSVGVANITRPVKFRADMTELLNAGFNESLGDSIGATGSFNGWTGTPAPLSIEGLGPAYSRVYQITGAPNSTVQWKFKGYTTRNPNPFLDGGWGQGSNSTFSLGTETTELVVGSAGDGLPTNIGFKTPKSFTVRFVCNTNGRRDLNNVSIDSLRAAGALTGNLNGIPYGIYLAGEGVFGSWPGWDTATLRSSITATNFSDKRFEQMVPSSTFGAGFYEVTIPVNFLTVGPFKYSVFYNGIFGNPAPSNGILDNEAGFGVNKIANFNNATTVTGNTYTVIGIFGQGDGGLSVGNERKVENFELSQNYPNPFNPSTSIKFSVPAASDVRLEVFNILGQKVATLVNTRLNAGTYTQNFNAINMSSGVYFYRLQAGSFNKTMKMTLVK